MNKVDEYLIIIEGFQLFLFALILFFQHKSENQSRRILSIFFFISFIVYCDIGLYYLGYFTITKALYYLFSPLLLLIMPVFYFYVKSITGVNLNKAKNNIYHFYPSILVFFISTILFSLLDNEQKTWFIRYGYSEISDVLIIRILSIFEFGVSSVILLLQFVYYFVLISSLLRMHKKKIGDVFSNFEQKRLNWIRITIYVFFIFFITTNIVVQTNSIDAIEIRLIFNSLLILFTIFLGLSGIRQIEIFIVQEVPLRANARKEAYSIRSKEIEEVKDTNDIHHMVKQINICMTEKKLFLNPDLKIIELAKETSISQKIVSQAIKEELHTNFYHYVNTFRIDEAKRLLKDGQANRYSIEGIAIQSGFHSRSSFYSAFKKHTGHTPGECRKKK